MTSLCMLQADVLRACGVSQLLDAALAGYNVTVFAYGQTVGILYCRSATDQLTCLPELAWTASVQGIP